MLLLVEAPGVEEAADGPLSGDEGRGLTNAVRNDDQEDGVDVDRLRLEVEDLGNRRAEAGQPDAQGEGPERVRALARVVVDFERLGRQLERRIERCVGCAPWIVS